MKSNLFRFPVVCLFICFVKSYTLPTNKPQLIILSFDGFRYDYINRFNTPNFDKIARSGVHAPKGYKSTFTTKTFPTHWTIATGLWEGNHGMIDNSFYDLNLNESFKRGMSDQKWYGGEPIWITAKKQDKTAKIFYWPGSEVEFDGLRPDFYFQNFSYEPKLENRLNKIVEWVNEGVDLSMGYFHEPDKVGHESGAFSEAVRIEVEKIDYEIGRFLKKLSKTERGKNVNLIILSDHGMANLTNTIYLQDYINFEEEIELFPQKGEVASLVPKEGKLNSVYMNLEKVPHMKVYKKENLPVRFHYTHPTRTMPLTLVADVGYYLANNRSQSVSIGHHGYDNELLSMRPLFYAKGPLFKRNRTTNRPFYAINLYSLFCYILDLNPAKNDGSIFQFRSVLKSKSLDTLDEQMGGVNPIEMEVKGK